LCVIIDQARGGNATKSWKKEKTWYKNKNIFLKREYIRNEMK
jgi:hypothetical protein